MSGTRAWPGIQYRTERVNYRLGRNRSEMIRLIFAMGKIQGTLYMRSHILLHRATTKYFSNSFVFKTKIEKEGLPRGSPAGLGAGGLELKSPRPDQFNHRRERHFPASGLALRGTEYSFVADLLDVRWSRCTRPQRRPSISPIRRPARAARSVIVRSGSFILERR